jgi:ribosomal protein S18 acetylase RimI-like enzyme
VKGTASVPTISRLSAAELLASAKELADLLVDAVESGSSLGFLSPFGQDAAASWWEELAPAVAEGRLLIWAARSGARLTGTVTLAPEDKPNGRHRAQIAKLIVHRQARGQGLGRELLALAEQAAAEAGVKLLLLDTEAGSPAERLYRSAGWTKMAVVPDYAADPAGVLQPCTFFYKSLGK